MLLRYIFFGVSSGSDGYSLYGGVFALALLHGVTSCGGADPLAVWVTQVYVITVPLPKCAAAAAAGRDRVRAKDESID